MQPNTYLVDKGSSPNDSPDQGLEKAGNMRQDINSIFPLSQRTIQNRRERTIFGLALPFELNHSRLGPEGFWIFRGP
jgi:hypothetical protein